MHMLANAVLLAVSSFATCEQLHECLMISRALKDMSQIAATWALTLITHHVFWQGWVEAASEGAGL